MTENLELFLSTDKIFYFNYEPPCIIVVTLNNQFVFLRPYNKTAISFYLTLWSIEDNRYYKIEVKILLTFSDLNNTFYFYLFNCK